MKRVLVTVNGATYYDGYKLDGRPKAGDKPGFEEWKDEYEEGGYDEEEELSRKQMTLDDEEAGHFILIESFHLPEHLRQIPFIGS